MQSEAQPWYVSRSVKLGDRRIRLEGIDPWVRFALHPGFAGDTARWWLKLKSKYQRWPWWKMSLPPRIYELRTYPITPPTSVEWAGGWALALWVLARLLRR